MTVATPATTQRMDNTRSRRRRKDTSKSTPSSQFWIVQWCTSVLILSPLLFTLVGAFQAPSCQMLHPPMLPTKSDCPDCDQTYHRNRKHRLNLSDPSSNIDQIEKEVLGSARDQMDRNAIEKSFSTTPSSSNADPQTTAVMASPWKIARAAATTASIVVAIVSGGDKLLSVITFVVVFVWAKGDPMDESDGVAGPFARLLGRATIKSIETSKPKLRAVAKAAISDVSAQEDAIFGLEQRVKQLEDENDKLRTWIDRRMWVDETQSQFTLDELKDMARKENLIVGGTKSQLMMRLLENGVDLGMSR